MTKTTDFYILILIITIAFAIFTYVFIDKRYRKNHGTDVPPGFEKTEEIIIDPSDGRKLRVYYNRKTGERYYYEEKSN
jgi:hypothetical protein